MYLLRTPYSLEGCESDPPDKARRVRNFLNFNQPARERHGMGLNQLDTSSIRPLT